MLAPLVSGGDDDAVEEAVFAFCGGELLAGRREERVDVGLLQIVAGVKELALDSPVVTSSTLAGHEVNAHIGAPAMRPLIPPPDLCQTVGVLRVGQEVVSYEPLELRTLVTIAARGFGQFSQQFLEC